LTAFFGTLLVLWNIPSPEPVSLLAGIALLLFTISNGFWQERHRAMVKLPASWSTSPVERTRWYQTVAWSRVSLAFLFFIAFLLVVRLWLKLPAVVVFLRSSGISL
jgi:hypothetical protein